MCVAFFALLNSIQENQAYKTQETQQTKKSDCYPRVECVICFNRDVDMQKPTRPLKIWGDELEQQEEDLKKVQENDSNIVGGKDLVLGGSWLLFNKKTQNIAFLTNFDDSQQKFGIGKRSRGQVILDFVSSDSQYTSEETTLGYLQQLADLKSEYNPYLLFVGNLKQSYYYHLEFDNSKITNLNDKSTINRYPGSEVLTVYNQHRSEFLLYGQSNSELTNPYPKIEHGMQFFTLIIQNFIKEFNFVHQEQESIQDNSTDNNKEIGQLIESRLLSKLKEDLMSDLQEFTKTAAPEDEESIFIKPYFSKKLQVMGTRSQTVLVVYSATETQREVQIKEVYYELDLGVRSISFSDKIQKIRILRMKFMRAVVRVIRIRRLSLQNKSLGTPISISSQTTDLIIKLG